MFSRRKPLHRSVARFGALGVDLAERLAGSVHDAASVEPRTPASRVDGLFVTLFTDGEGRRPRRPRVESRPAGLRVDEEICAWS